MESPLPLPAAGSDTAVQRGPERRTQPDRRQCPTTPWAALWHAGRRLWNRRADERQRPYFVDRFPPTMFVLIMLLLFASLTDAVLTIRLLEAGGGEINPLMDHLLDYGVQPFLLVKYVLTAGGLPLLLILKNHRLFGTRLRVGHLIPMVVAMYILLIGYQLALLHKYAGW
jgi:hypothetical protein